MTENEVKTPNTIQTPQPKETISPEAVKEQPEPIVLIPEKTLSAEDTAKKVQVGKPFQKGDDPRRNLEGRPVGSENFKTVFERALEKIAKDNNKSPEEFYDQIIKVGLAKAGRGDYRFFKDFLDRLYGKPKESIDHTTKGEKITKSPVFILKDFSDPEENG